MGLRRGSSAIAAGVALFAVALSTPSRAGTTVDFDFDSARYLNPGEEKGARAFIAGGAPAAAAVPLVVFLHGVNAAGRPHRWMLENDRDLRPFVEQLVEEGRVEPLVLAAPTQTRGARTAATLWSGFELPRFVEEAARAVAPHASIDPSRVVIAGHSGAGCNPSGGLLAAAADEAMPPPLAVLFLDSCMNTETGALLGRLNGASRALVFWQNETWQREEKAFRAAFAARRGNSTSDVFRQFKRLGTEPHTSIVISGLRAALPLLLPPGRNESEGQV